MTTTLVPLRTVVTTERFLDVTYYVAKTGTIFENWMGDRVYLGGFALSPDEADATTRAQAELYERYFAHFDYHEERLSTSPYFKPIDDCSLVNTEYHFKDILMGPIPPDGRFVKDSTGLAWHFDRDIAVEKALSEVVERHLSSQIWFRDGMITQVGPTINWEEWTINTYTYAHKYALPYALTVFENVQAGCLLCGASLERNFSKAQEKSYEECFLMLGDILRGNQGVCASPGTVDRLRSLRDRLLSADRADQFARKTVSNDVKTIADTKFSIFETIALLFGDNTKWSAVQICEIGGNSLVRGVIPEALNLYKERELQENRSVVSDPFC
ncbi:hypothetical protein [Parvularcula sp. IMCC14364]|uniref:hypothetical protein n=1 Tax=Parvularcula sp. IMCC14364 TaxID=3067902 RepID=UPI00274242A2|nr:hypothetical protein [Parvularcula sp. IMCC14364]